MSKCSYPKFVKELPLTEYFAIIWEEQTHVEGDECSKTNPGHGYPAHTVNNFSIQTFLNEDDWKAEIKRQTGLVWGKKFQAVRILPARVEVQTIVTTIIQK